MSVELLILRLVHIVGGMFWVGAALFMAFFLMPTLGRLGPVAGQVMGGLQERKLMTWLPLVAILTIISGVRLMMIVSGGNGDWFRHRVGHTYSVAAALAIIAWLLGVLVSRPTIVKIMKLTQGATDDAARRAIAPEVQKLQARSALITKVATVLLLLSAAGMAVARYL